ncbi:g7814 [Coccomyxa elongata]
MVQETSVQGSLRTKSERKICTSCKVDKPASDFWASRTSRDGLQHFCIPCKVIEAEAAGLTAPSTRVTASEAVCTRCKQLKPGADFYRNSSKKTGLHSRCKVCSEEWQKQRREKLRELPPDRSADVEYKVCGRCHAAKPSEEFSRDNNSRDGLSNHCANAKRTSGI